MHRAAASDAQTDPPTCKVSSLAPCPLPLAACCPALQFAAAHVHLFSLALKHVFSPYAHPCRRASHPVLLQSTCNIGAYIGRQPSGALGPSNTPASCRASAATAVARCCCTGIALRCPSTPIDPEPTSHTKFLCYTWPATAPALDTKPSRVASGGEEAGWTAFQHKPATKACPMAKLPWLHGQQAVGRGLMQQGQHLCLCPVRLHDSVVLISPSRATRGALALPPMVWHRQSFARERLERARSLLQDSEEHQGSTDLAVRQWVALLCRAAEGGGVMRMARSSRCCARQHLFWLASGVLWLVVEPFAQAGDGRQGRW